MNRLFAFVGAVVALCAHGAQQAYKPGDSVDLSRVYAEGESQDYTLKLTIVIEAAGDQSIEGEAEFNLSVSNVGDDGTAELVQRIDSMKLSFGGQELPQGDLPEPKTLQMDSYGLPSTIDVNDENDPIGIMMPAFILPAATVTIGDEFDVSWESEDGKFTIEGKGTLVATGRLYEEHVSKITYDLIAQPDGEPEGEFEVTTYTNSQTGKMVKASGTLTSEDPEMGGAFEAVFTIAKVRD